jgi:hypothetical protein
MISSVYLSISFRWASRGSVISTLGVSLPIGRSMVRRPPAASMSVTKKSSTDTSVPYITWPDANVTLT